MESAISANFLAEVGQNTPELIQKDGENAPKDIINPTETTEIPKPAAEKVAQKDQSFDTELSAVIGNLTSFWGVFKRESEATIASVSREISELQKTDFEAVSKTLLSQGESLISRGESYLQKGESIILAKGESLLHQVESTIKNAIEVVAPAEDETTEPSLTVPQQGSAGSRVDQLINRLRTDPLILKVDPEAEPAWLIYKKSLDNSQTSWETIRDKELQSQDKDLILAQCAKLVPESLTEEQFWMRYGYRHNQIMTQEQSRQSLLAAAQKKDQEPDNFSWDDDGSTPAKLADTPGPIANSDPVASAGSNSAALSPRASEDSYDVISGAGSEKFTRGTTTAGSVTPAITIDEETPSQAEKDGSKKQSSVDSEDSDWD